MYCTIPYFFFFFFVFSARRQVQAPTSPCAATLCHLFKIPNGYTNRETAQSHSMEKWCRKPNEVWYSLNSLCFTDGLSGHRQCHICTARTGDAPPQPVGGIIGLTGTCPGKGQYIIVKQPTLQTGN